MHTGFLRRCLLVLVILLSRAVQAADDEQQQQDMNNGNDNNNDEDEEMCDITSECRMCSTSDKESIEQCDKTGKIEVVTCISISNNATQQEDRIQRQKVYRSCKRTSSDDEFLMIRLQVFCLLIGVTAFASSRKQKQLNASLFDQRSLNRIIKPTLTSSATMRRESDTIEMSANFIQQQQKDQETAPLTMNVV